MREVAIGGNQLPRLLRLLSNIGKTNRLQEITLQVDGPGYHGPLDWSHLREVDCTLAQAHPECLQKVVIWLWAGGNAKWVRENHDNLVRYFPLLRAKGISVDAC